MQIKIDPELTAALETLGKSMKQAACELSAPHPQSVIQSKELATAIVYAGERVSASGDRIAAGLESIAEALKHSR